MTHDPTLGDPAELAALYAAGAMPSAELARFEEHLETGCATCQDELDKHVQEQHPDKTTTGG